MNVEIKKGIFQLKNPSPGGRWDSNPRPSEPQTDALTN